MPMIGLWELNIVESLGGQSRAGSRNDSNRVAFGQFCSPPVSVEAGRIMLRRLNELASAGQDFAFETTLSGNAFRGSMDRWRSMGYVVRVVHLWLESPDLAIARVRRRVQHGGHSVPDDVVRRRFDRAIVNFATRYRDAADEWQLYDNSDPVDRRVVARGARGSLEVVDPGGWARFEQVVGRIARTRETLMTDRPPIPDDHLARCFRDTTVLEHAMRITHARVIRRHRLLNEPLVIGRNGEVLFVDPHTVPMPEGVTEEEMGPVFDYL
jgi:predicted ABC-type ATPase